jgi:hypothetical protein
MDQWTPRADWLLAISLLLLHKGWEPQEAMPLGRRKVIVSGMEQTNMVLLFKLFTVLALAVFVLVFWRPSKGGRPPRPMHPSPADDTVLLWRRRKKKLDPLY